MSSFQFNGANYSSARAAGFAHAAGQRLAAEKRRRAGRQLAHDSAASSRAAEKRAKKRHEINNRPRGRTEAIGQHPDGRPIYRAIPAFRARPYTPPIERKERPEPVTPTLNGARLNLHPTSERIAAARKAEAQQVPLLDNEHRIAQRAARKVRMARRRRRGF